MPSCGRCMRLLGHCPGYPDRWLLTLRRQDAHAAQLVNTRVERSRSRRAEQAGLIDMPVVRTLDFSAETMSVHKFFADYTAQSGVAFLELLADKYTLPSMSCLSAALEATAMASSSRQLRQSGLMTRTRQAYSKAISRIRHAMQDESLIKEDSVLLSLFVLGLFQVRAVRLCLYLSSYSLVADRCSRVRTSTKSNNRARMSPPCPRCSSAISISSKASVGEFTRPRIVGVILGN